MPKGTQWLRLDAGASFRQGGDSQGFTILVFFCKLYLWNSVTTAKSIRYTDLDPQKSLRFSNDLLKWCHWRDAMADSGINDQLTKMLSTHSLSVF